MAGVVATPSRPKRGRSKAPAFSDFFGAKVKTLLLRTRRVVTDLPPEVGGAAAALLANLDPFADAGSLKDVLEKLGGEGTLAAKIFFSVMDAPDREELELFAKRRQVEQQQFLFKQMHVLVQRVQDLAKQLPDDDPLVGHVLALQVNVVQEEVEDDTGEQQSVTDNEKKKKKKETRQEKKTVGKKKKKGKKEKKRSRSAAKSGEKEKKEKEKKKKTKRGGGAAREGAAEGAAAAAAGAATEKESEPLAEEEEEPVVAVSNVCEDDVLCRLLKEAEDELVEVQNIAKGQGVVPLNVPPEAPPNVERLIGSASLEDVLCLHIEEKVALNTVEAHMALQVWWRTAKRACQVHGVFQLLRTQKEKTLEQRYAALIAEQADCLSFKQAYKYDRLGKFLAQFPLFVFQRKWTSLADWFHPATENGAVLVDALPSIGPVSSIFLRDGFSLHVHGFQVMPALMTDKVNDQLISTCKTRCEQEGEVIFNNVKKAESRHNDGLRVQLSTDKIDGTAPFKATLAERLKDGFPLHKVDSMVALLSKPGCKAQLAHTDYTPKTLANATDDKMPLACLVALMDGTALDVWPGAIRGFDKSRRVYHPMQVKLNKGDMLIFRGDLVHAGAACGEVANLRFHAYMDVEGVKRPKHGDGVKETHFIEKRILGRE
jgi:hypothetical protein